MSCFHYLMTCLAVGFLVGDAYAAEHPNIVLIYTDDVGFGDVSCNGQTALLTPRIDELAKSGLRFTDAHCSAATCTPSRYALLTGRYAFRQENSSIRPGDANLIIEPGACTVPGVLAAAGYHTGVVGKWHLGLGDGPIDWNGEVTPGPNEIGFDYHFLIPATGDRVPCVYLEQGRVVGLSPEDPIAVSYGSPVGDEPTGRDRPDLLKQKLSQGHDGTIVNGISRIGYMAGGRSARWVDEEMAEVITEKAADFILADRDRPFFLMYSSHDIHVPRAPHSRFVGSSGLGPRGDAMKQLDWCVGEIVDTVKRLGSDRDTMIIFTSDNGPVLDDGYADMANEKNGEHKPSGGSRAGKYSMYEGGTRVPMIVSWPGRIPAGQVSSALFGQVDLLATFARLVGGGSPSGSVVDSRDELDTLLGEDIKGRPHLVHEAQSLALRQGPWKYVSAGKTRDLLGPWRYQEVAPPGALYHLGDDSGETRDLAAQHPDRLRAMRALLRRIREGSDGRTND